MKCFNFVSFVFSGSISKHTRHSAQPPTHSALQHATCSDVAQTELQCWRHAFSASKLSHVHAQEVAARSVERGTRATCVTTPPAVHQRTPAPVSTRTQPPAQASELRGAGSSSCQLASTATTATAHRSATWWLLQYYGVTFPPSISPSIDRFAFNDIIAVPILFVHDFFLTFWQQNKLPTLTWEVTNFFMEFYISF